jgi:hypothetical protein
MTNPAAIQLDPKMRESIDSIKAELGKGKVVIRPRQTGKTAALLEVIHENSPGMVDVFTCHANEAERFRRLYKEMFPGDEQPRIFPFQWALSERVRGTTGRKWATDEVWPDAVINKAHEYKFVTYFGGVGTPMCMDMHSN